MRNKLLFLVVVILTLVSCNDNKAKPDNEFDVSVSEPKLKNIKPRVLFDEAHKNHHQIETTYKPFATLITNDGCSVKSTHQPTDNSALATADVYIIATAMGKEDPGDKSPFTQNEIDLVEQWVRNGGSLLLITEHFPFGLAMSPVLNPRFCSRIIL